MEKLGFRISGPGGDLIYGADGVLYVRRLALGFTGAGGVSGFGGGRRWF